jgi:hypothetical protein
VPLERGWRSEDVEEYNKFSIVLKISNGNSPPNSPLTEYTRNERVQTTLFILFNVTLLHFYSSVF